MIETHICPECTPAVGLEAARQELGCDRKPFKVCESCVENLEQLYEPPLVYPWTIVEQYGEIPRTPYANRPFDVMQQVAYVGRPSRYYFVKAQLYPLY